MRGKKQTKKSLRPPRYFWSQSTIEKSYFLNSVYPHLPQASRFLCSPRKMPGPHLGHDCLIFFALLPLIS